MSINEQMVQDIVQDVLAKMQIASDVQGDRGVFKDMNEAIEAAKASQKIVRKMSLDQREKNYYLHSKKNKRKCRNPCTYGC